MYQWLLFLHIATVLAFLLAHGVQMTVMWKQRWEADPRHNLALFEALPELLPLRLLAGAVVDTGFLLVFNLSLWGRGWIWLSLLILGAIWLLMYRYGGGYYQLIEEAANRAIEAQGSADESAATAAFAKARMAWHPIGMTVVGIVGLGAILWLMIFKPF